MICGSSEEYDTTTVAVFDNLLACSTHYNATPHKTPEPFDADRDGLVVGEGIGAVIGRINKYRRSLLQKQFICKPLFYTLWLERHRYTI